MSPSTDSAARAPEPARGEGSNPPTENGERVGLWLVGARGAIATSVAYGVLGLRRGLVAPTGVPTLSPPLDALDLVPLDAIVLGGHDVCTRDLSRAAGELVAAGILDADLVASVSDDASRYEAAIRPGILDAVDPGFADLDPRAADLGARAPRDQVNAIRADIDAFASDNDLDRVVVVSLISVEAATAPQTAWDSIEGLEAAIDSGVSQPASVLYAYAAITSSRPYVNFTPNIGASIPALVTLSDRLGVPIAGSDGKTGETLVKTVLAPMFRARALRVLAWQGYNMLGNRDGEVLKEPSHREAKLRSKDEALRSILRSGGVERSDLDGDLHTKVAIDYVPSLGDWKTAWDFIHFEGFLGAKMSLQFTWTGCDSALAAPLVIDLARLVAFASKRGEGGVQEHLACYFKSPQIADRGAGQGADLHNFHKQIETLYRYVDQRS